MSERWDQGIDKKLAPGKAFVSITPAWLRFGLIAAAFAAALYLAFEDRQPFRALWLTFGSYQLGFVITLLIFLVPCLIVIYALAFVMHRHRRKRDFPSATVHRPR